MRIAFVGKGGSGKSTVSTLFFLYLVKKGIKTAFIDADLNIHTPKLLGVDFPVEKSISSNINVSKIREFLKGGSDKIKSVDHFYKTTPPSSGVNRFELLEQNEIINNYFLKYKNSYIGVVGTYEEDEIGRSCYHTNLSIFENLLSFAKLKENEAIVADMVAGIDAFSNTLHMQFDTLALIIEPTKESIDVFKQYKDLAESVDIYKNVYIVGNKVEDEGDIEYIKENTDANKFIGSLPNSRKLKELRRNNLVLDTNALDLFEDDLFELIYNKSLSSQVNPSERLEKLHQLHIKYISQDYVKNAVGDISDQIEIGFLP